MKLIRVRSRYGYLLSAKAAKTCLLLVAVLAPLAWVLLFAWQGSNGLMRTLYLIGATAPLAGIVVALLSLIGATIKGRVTRLTVGEQIDIPGSGVRFDTADLGRIQLFSKKGHSFAAFVPRYVAEQLHPSSLRESTHNLDAYIVEFPQGSTIKSFELADVLRHRLPDLQIDKIGRI